MQAYLAFIHSDRLTFIINSTYPSPQLGIAMGPYLDFNERPDLTILEGRLPAIIRSSDTNEEEESSRIDDLLAKFGLDDWSLGELPDGAITLLFGPGRFSNVSLPLTCRAETL